MRSVYAHKNNNDDDGDNKFGPITLLKKKIMRVMYLFILYK